MNTLTEKELENLSVGTLLWVGDDGKEWVIKRFLKYLKENKSLPVRVSDINDTSNLGYKHSKMCFVKNPGNYNTQKKFTNAEVDQINLQESLCTCRCTTIVPKESEYIKTLIITDNSKYEGELKYRRDLETNNWHYWEKPNGKLIHAAKSKLVWVEEF